MCSSFKIFNFTDNRNIFKYLFAQTNNNTEPQIIHIFIDEYSILISNVVFVLM